MDNQNKPNIEIKDQNIEELYDNHSSERGFITQRKRLVDFVYPMVTGTVGDGTVVSDESTSYAVQLADAAGESVYFTHIAPFNLSTSSIELVWLPAGTGNMYYLLQFTAYSKGKAVNTDSTTRRTVAGTNGKVQFTRIDNVFGKQFGKYTKAGDILGIKLFRDASSINDTINSTVNIIGLRILYT